MPKNSLFSAAIKVARPVHWVKNLAIFAALFLTGALFEKGELMKVIWAFISFSLATSATYIVNDILDAGSDRLHPTKRFRPIASGALPVPIAILESLILAGTALFIAAVNPALNSLFFILVAGYLVLQFFYSLGLKNIATLDILIIATGFIMRVYAGAFVIDAHLSVWFLLCVISTALFLASGKRRAELNLVGESNS